MNGRAKSNDKKRLTMNLYSFSKFAFLLCCFLCLTGCYTFNLSNVMTSGEATDVIDSAQTNDQDPDVRTDVNVTPL